MKVWIAGLLVALAAATAHAATDPLAEARRFYNLGQYDNAARFARDAMKLPATTDGARLILGRIYLEQYRRSADADHLMQAREALRAVNTQGLDRRERVELAIGLGEALFLDDKFGPAAVLYLRSAQVALRFQPSEEVDPLSAALARFGVALTWNHGDTPRHEQRAEACRQAHRPTCE